MSSIDIRNEELVAIAKAPAFIPGRPGRATVWRWVLTGVRGRKLETILVGGRRFTSREAIERFIENGTTASAGEPTHTRTNRQRERAIEQAERELAAAGI